MTTYTLRDTFNNCTISKHRTLEAAAKADKAYNRKIKKANGPTSHIPTVILKDGKRLEDAEYESMLYLLNIM